MLTPVVQKLTTNKVDKEVEFCFGSFFWGGGTLVEIIFSYNNVEFFRAKHNVLFKTQNINAHA